jgi:hypothetical protein
MLHLLNPFRTLTPGEMLAKQLDEAQRSKIASAAIAEEHAAHVAMLEKRIARIQREIQAMNQTPTPQPGDPSQ